MVKKQLSDAHLVIKGIVIRDSAEKASVLRFVEQRKAPQSAFYSLCGCLRRKLGNGHGAAFARLWFFST